MGLQKSRTQKKCNPADLVATWLAMVWLQEDGKASRALGVSRMTLWRWLEGVKAPSSERIERMQREIAELTALDDATRAERIAAKAGIAPKFLTTNCPFPSEREKSEAAA